MQLLSQATKSPAHPARCAEEMLDALPPVMRFVRKHMRSQRAHGLSVPQFRAMVFLRTAPDAKLAAVAEFLGASMPTTSRIVSGLVARGFVSRCEGSKDRRCVKLVLTTRGRSVAEKATRATRARLARELASLGDAERNAILMGMKSLRSLFSPVLRLAQER